MYGMTYILQSSHRLWLSPPPSKSAVWTLSASSKGYKIFKLCQMLSEDNALFAWLWWFESWKWRRSQASYPAKTLHRNRKAIKEHKGKSLHVIAYTLCFEKRHRAYGQRTSGTRGLKLLQGLTVKHVKNMAVNPTLSQCDTLIYTYYVILIIAKMIQNVVTSTCSFSVESTV